jgi:Flp pilus assembly protein TadG
MSKQASRDRSVARLQRDERGSALIEFVISILLILTILFVTVELSSAVYTYTVLSDAANEGLRYAIVHSSDAGVTATSVVKTYASYSLHDVSSINVSVTCPSWVPPNIVTVTVSYSYIPYLSAFMKTPPTMTAYAEGRLVY